MSTVTPDQVSAVAEKVYRDWINSPTASFVIAIKRAVEAGVRMSTTPSGVGLTRAQRELLDFITGYDAEHNYAPSFDEMKAAVGLKSKSGIHRLILALEERGAIARLPNRARAIEILHRPAKAA